MTLFVRFPTVIWAVVLVPVKPPGLDVAVYSVIGDPPLLAGGANLTVAAPLPGVAMTARGAVGTVAGVTALDGADAGPVPTPFVAVTVNV